MRNLIRSRTAAIAVAVAVLAGAGALVASVGGGDEELRAGSLRVEPPRIAFDGARTDPDGLATAELRLVNLAGTSASYELSSDAPWLVLGVKDGIVAGGATARVVLRADPRAIAGRVAGALTVTSAGAAADVALTLSPGAGAPGEGSFDAVPSSLDLGETSTEGTVTLVNSTAAEVEWSVRAPVVWMTVAPEAGSIAPGGRATVTIRIDRAGLPQGPYTLTIPVVSDGRNTSVTTTLRVTDAPLLRVSTDELNFGKARAGKTKRTFQVSNAGRAQLIYQVSNDRFYVAVSRGARGTLPSGGVATVEVVFDHSQSLDGVRDFPIQVTSNGGSASVRVYGITDSRGPRAHDENISFVHTHADGEIYRHGRARFVDQDSEPAGGRVMWRVCAGNPPAAPSCSGWTLVEMTKAGTDIWQAEVGPLPACTGTIGQYVNWRIQADDDLGNRQYNPGSSTFYGFEHCPPAG